MKMVRSVTASAIATAMLATAATPAMARDYSGYGYGYGYGNGYGYNHDRYRHRNRGVSAGDVIAGVAVVGIIAAIASAASNKNRRNGGISSEDRAIDACSASVEQQFGGGARVDGIDQVYRIRDGYEVRGSVDSRQYRGSDTQQFTCSVRYGAVADVRFDQGYSGRGY